MKHRFLIIGIAVCLAWNAGAAEPWTLEQAIRCALTNSPDARLAQQRIASAQAGLSQANAAFSPQAQFASSYSRSDNPMQVFGSILNQRAYGSSLNFNDVPDTDNLNVKGLVTMPLYAGGRNVAARDAAKANTKAAKQSAEATRNILAFEVARTFHTVLKTREFIKATEAGVLDFETNAAFAVKRFNAGTLLKPDVLDVEVRLAQAREDLVCARNANALSLRALRTSLALNRESFPLSKPHQRQPFPKKEIFRDALNWRRAVSAKKQRKPTFAVQAAATNPGLMPSEASITITAPELVAMGRVTPLAYSFNGICGTDF